MRCSCSSTMRAADNAAIGVRIERFTRVIQACGMPASSRS